MLFTDFCWTCIKTGSWTDTGMVSNYILLNAIIEFEQIGFKQKFSFKCFCPHSSSDIIIIGYVCSSGLQFRLKEESVNGSVSDEAKR